MSNIRKVLGRKYQACYVYDASDIIRSIYLNLKRSQPAVAAGYLEHVLATLIVEAGRRVRILSVPKLTLVNLQLGHYSPDVIEQAIQDLERVVYRMLLPLCYKDGDGVILEPDELVVTTSGEVWLCWTPQS